LQERPDLLNVFGRFFEPLMVEVPLNGISDDPVMADSTIPDPDEQISVLAPITLEVLVVAVDLDQTPG
jgi:hypothetical protein